MELLGTIFSAIIGGIFSLFGKKTAATENTQAVEVANKAGALSADEARANRAQTEKDLDANHAQTDADIVALHGTDSLSDGAAAINQDIARSRAHPGANS